MKQVNYNGRGDAHLYTVSTLFVHIDPVVYHLETNKPLIIIIINVYSTKLKTYQMEPPLQ